MMCTMNTRTALCWLLPGLLGLAAQARAAEDNVTIYRCTDARGHVTLRDSPCMKGQSQETREMLRPKDAPYRPPPPRPARVETPAPAREVVIDHAPRPLYECVTPDGELYTSETPEGNPRWVPLWTLGYPYGGAVLYGGVDRGSVSFNTRNVRIDMTGTRVRPPIYSDAAWAMGTWIRDECHALPPAEVCARLRDRRDEINRRFFNAQPSERDTLRVEERGVVARLDEDCGGH
jgi:hypothetical protein